jgi:succinate dehydrogenase / fumarate reductase cytochrome b subunit
VSIPDLLFLSALSVLVVALGAFSFLVVLSGLRRAGGPVGGFGVRNTLQALELRPSAGASGARWAFYLHRVSGVGVLGFLLLHIVDVSLFAFSTRLYDRVHRLYSTPELRVLECGLIFAVLFHTLNGLRILAIDGWSLSARIARLSLVPVVVITLVAGIVASAVILAPVL